MKKVILIMLAGSMIVFNSCTKTGPQGPAGPQGATGATGAAGQNGLDGNANVLGTAPFTVLPNTWALTGHIYSVSFTDPDITNAIASTGVVEIFREYNPNQWSPLPDINGITSVVYDFAPGGFNIYIQNSDGSTPATPLTMNFRVVIISSSQRQAHPNTNWKNYNEAMTALNTANMQSQSFQ